MNPMIALAARSPQFDAPDPARGLNRLAQVLQIQAAQNQGEMAQYGLAKAKREDADATAVSEAYRTSMGPDGAVDRNKLYTTLATGGQGAKIPTLQKTFLDTDKATADIDKTKAETVKFNVETQGKVMDQFRADLVNVNTPEQAQAWMRAQYAHPQLGKFAASKMPLEQALASIPSDPAQFQQWKQQSALGMAKFLELQEAARHNKTVETETGRHNRSNEGIQGGQLAETRRHNGVVETQGNTAVTYQQDANGNFVALPSKVQPGTVVRAQQVAAPGAGLQPLAGKPPEALQKELTNISQQRAIVKGAIDAVKANPDAFSFSRGAATMVGPLTESVAGRFDSDAQRQSRSYLFNNVSKVINERAGAAQSSQELARLRSFLPAETDNADQIVSKMTAFGKYLDDLEAGTRGARGGGGGNPPAADNDPLGIRK